MALFLQGKKMSVNVGIDPGRWGAMALLVDGELISAWPLKHRKYKLNNGRDRYELDINWLVSTIRAINCKYNKNTSGITVHIEELKSGAQGAGAFNFGMAYGLLKGVLKTMVPDTIENINFVPVSDWKKHFDLKEKRRGPGVARKTGPEKKAIKQRSIDKAKELWPNFTSSKFGNFETRSGVAEAALIAASQL